MIVIRDRIRSTDQTRYFWAAGESLPPVTPRSYSFGSQQFGFKKQIVDKVSRLQRVVKDRDLRMWADLSPSEKLARRLSRLKRTHVVSKRKIPPKDITAIKPVRIQSFHGYATRASMDTTGFLPSNWTNYRLVGEWAGCLTSVDKISTVLGRPWGYFVTFPPFDQLYVDWCIERAWNECAAPDGELAVAMAELPQLISLIASPFKAVAAGASKFRSLFASDAWVLIPSVGLRSLRTKRQFPKRKVTKAFLDEASTRWLEIQYGLLPSISDAELVLQAIDQTLEPLKDIMYGKSKYTAANTRKVIRGEQPMVPNFLFGYSAEFVSKTVYTSKVYYTYKDIPSLAGRLGFEPTALLNFIWELTPWSFVLDWLWDIGGLLNRLSNSDKISVVSSYVSIKHDHKVTGHLTSARYGNGSSLKCPTSRLYLHQEELLRIANPSVPQLPQFNVKWFNVTRSLNALSLLWQKMPR